MSMPNEMVWVIKKGEYYVNPKYRALFTGHTDGFTFYSNEEIVKEKLAILDEGYYSEYINLRDIPEGERVYYD